MQQRTRRLFIVVGGSALVSVAAILAACSSENGTSSGALPTLPTRDSGRDGDQTPPGQNPPKDDGGPGDGGADADCSKAPKLRDNTDGFFCPFTSRDAGPDSGTCGKTEVCCAPGIPSGSDAGFPPSYCAAQTKGESDTREATCAAQARGADSQWETGNRFNSMWECADGSNCGPGQVCCIVTQPDAGGPANIGPNQNKQDIPAACGALQAFKSNGTKCKAQCAAGTEFKTCSLNEPSCQPKSTCTPFAGSANSRSSTRDLGYCKPDQE